MVEWDLPGERRAIAHFMQAPKPFRNSPCASPFPRPSSHGSWSAWRTEVHLTNTLSLQTNVHSLSSITMLLTATQPCQMKAGLNQAHA